MIRFTLYLSSVVLAALAFFLINANPDTKVLGLEIHPYVAGLLSIGFSVLAAKMSPFADDSSSSSSLFGRFFEAMSGVVLFGQMAIGLFLAVTLLPFNLLLLFGTGDMLHLLGAVSIGAFFLPAVIGMLNEA